MKKIWHIVIPQLIPTFFVLLIMSIGNFLNTGMEEYGFNDTLDRLETELEEGFIRCHRSFLVNKTMIESVWLSQNRQMLEDDIEIPLSRSYKPLIKEFLEGRREHGSSK